MTSSGWTLHNRGFARTLVYLPGWATDYRLLPKERLTWNVLAPDGLACDTEGLADAIAQLSAPPVLVGWSLGASLAAEFVQRHPAAVNGVVLVSGQPSWALEPIDTLREALAVDSRAALRRFYAQCFHGGDRAAFASFRRGLESDYLDRFALTDLIAGLDALAAATLPHELIAAPVRCLHGSGDIVAPVADMVRWANDSGVPIRVVDGASHAIIVRDEFIDTINGLQRG
ncbi:MAG TPA: alpha/beta hydrolase [Capsulimonadaceae bacterium]|jgi:pimeloyl-ACP methyl ester carboxylesterase